MNILNKLLHLVCETCLLASGYVSQKDIFKLKLGFVAT